MYAHAQMYARIMAMDKEALQVALFFIFILGGGVGFLLAQLLF